MAISICMTDAYHQTYEDEIFQNSQCIWHENALMDWFRSQLIALGYESVSDNRKVWRCGDRTVVVCLVDDFTTCSDQYSMPTPYLFDSKTTVITDNWVSVPTQYQVLQLPRSFYGIYSHWPRDTQWRPDRRFALAVRRLDAKRLLLWLELEQRRSMQSDQTQDYVNFNAWSWDSDNSSDQGRRNSVDRQYQLLEPQFRDIYRDTFERLLPQVPVQNHSLSHEQMHVSAWMNLVMETYSSDACVALSEKIFRAMCLPVPWAVYGGRHTVAYLRSMGFDVMPDIIQHRYDPAVELRTAAYGDKMVDWLYEATDAVQHMQGQDWSQLVDRTQQAAHHNQALLAEFRRQWPADFAQWWSRTIIEIAK